MKGTEEIRAIFFTETNTKVMNQLILISSKSDASFCVLGR